MKTKKGDRVRLCFNGRKETSTLGAYPAQVSKGIYTVEKVISPSLIRITENWVLDEFNAWIRVP